MKARRAKFKVGDVVRIDNPECVIRVGYPHTVEDYADKVWTPDALAALDRLCEALKLRDYERAKNKLKMPLASLLLHRAGFGGRDREVHTNPAPWVSGVSGVVTEVRYCITGRYVPASNPYGDEWEAPELEERKQRRLLHIDTRSGHGEVVIEDKNVTLLEAAP